MKNKIYLFYLGATFLIIPQEVAIMGGLEPNHVMTGVVLGLIWFAGLMMIIKSAQKK